MNEETAVELSIVNPVVKEFLNQKYRPADQRLLSFREIGERNLVPIILKETESVLSMLLKLTRPDKILEIGTAIGYSAAFFAYSCPDAEIYSIEKDDNSFRIAGKNIEAAGLEGQVHLYHGDGEDEIRRMGKEGINGFDLVFIDAGKSHYRRFLDAALTVSSDHAVIISDNILIHGLTVTAEQNTKNKHKTHMRKMREYLDYICSNPRFDTTLMAVGDGMAVSLLQTT